MFIASSMYGIKVELKQADPPSGKSSGAVEKIKYPLEGVVTRLDCKTKSLKVWSKQ